MRNDSTQHSVAEGEYMRSNICDTYFMLSLESHVTSSSSRLTSSDKLSALPSSTSPNVARPTWFSTFTALTNNKRGFVVLMLLHPSLFLQCQIPICEYSATICGANARSETNINNGILERHPTPETTPKQRVSFDSDRSLPTMHSVGQGTIYQGSVYS
jgi:hypothetical protein